MPIFSTAKPCLQLATGYLLGIALLSPLAQADVTDTMTDADDTTGPVITLINPNSNEDSTRSMVELARLEVKGTASVVGKSNAGAPPLLTSPQDMRDAAPGVVALGVEAAQQDRVAAIIVSAFSDPGLEELRAAVDIPVFGIGEEAFHAAARDGRPFAIATVTPDEALIASFRERAVELGYESQYRGVRVTPGDPTQLVASEEKLDAALAEAVKAAVEEDAAEAVIMGGGPLSAAALRIQPQFEVPLVVAVSAAAQAAVRTLEE